MRLSSAVRQWRDHLLLLLGYRKAVMMDQRLSEEMRFHVDMATERNVRAGMAPDEARRAALLAFGGPQQWREATRDEIRSRPAEELMRDVRYAVHSLRLAPAFTAAVVATLALSIGATTAIFSVVNAVLLRPLPYAGADRLVALCEKSPTWKPGTPMCGPGEVNPGNYLAWHDQVRSLVNAAAFYETRTALSARGRDAISVLARVSTASIFPTLGARPVLGRFFFEAEDVPGGPPVVVLSYAFWRNQLGGDSSVIGSRILLNGTSQTVIGVAGPEAELYEHVDVWVPTRFSAAQRTASGRSLRAVGRLKAGATIEAANKELRAIAAQRGHDLPDVDANWSAFAVPLREQLVGGSQRMLWTLLGAVGFLLLIACANVANLHLARAADRQREIALRVSLGASPSRVIRQLLTENAVLAAGAGLLGFLLAFRATSTLVALVPDRLSIQTLHEVSMDWRVLVFAAVLTLFTVVLFGLAPAIQTTRADVQSLLKEGGRTGSSQSRRSGRLRSALVVAEMSLALVLLAGAGLMARSMAALDRVSLGFDAQHVFTARVALPTVRYPNDTATVRAFEALLSRIQAIPGVTNAGLVSHLPLSGARSASGFDVEGFPVLPQGEKPVGDMRAVTPGYFAAMKIPILEGRDLTAGDGIGSAPVAVVSATLAHKFWPNGSAIGHYLDYEWDKMEHVRIVGVTGDIHHVDARTQPFMEIYRPLTQFAWHTMFLVVHVTGDPSQYSAPIRNALRSVDPEVPLASIRPMAALVSESVGVTRLSAVLFALFGGLGLLLAAIGIYGVMSYTVQQRRHEIGVRLALGAAPRAVVALIVRRGAALSLTGIVLGFVLASLGTTAMEKLLFGVGTHDGATFIGAALLLGAVAVFACYLPGKKATRVNALTALRGG